ncbi:MAG: DUF2798 domain-containing protein [Bacteroidota bacterium]
MKQKFLFALIMGGITTGLVSFTVISVNIGFVKSFAGIWLKSWVIAYVVAIPAILLFSPSVQWLVKYLCEKSNIINEN